MNFGIINTILPKERRCSHRYYGHPHLNGVQISNNSQFTYKSPPDTADLEQRKLELSHVSRRTLAAMMEYQRLRAEELKLITAIEQVQDELGESNTYIRTNNL